MKSLEFLEMKSLEKLQLHVSDETVRKAILKLGYVYKKKSLHASEQERPRCQGEAEKLERTSVGERRKSSGISRRKWCKHGHDKTLCPFQKEHRFIAAERPWNSLQNI